MNMNDRLEIAMHLMWNGSRDTYEDNAKDALKAADALLAAAGPAPANDVARGAKLNEDNADLEASRDDEANARADLRKRLVAAEMQVVALTFDRKAVEGVRVELNEHGQYILADRLFAALKGGGK